MAAPFAQFFSPIQFRHQFRHISPSFRKKGVMCEIHFAIFAMRHLRIARITARALPPPPLFLHALHAFPPPIQALSTPISLFFRVFFLQCMLTTGQTCRS